MFTSITKETLSKMTKAFNFLMKKMNVPKQERSYIIACDKEKGIHLFATVIDGERNVKCIYVWQEKGYVRYEIE